jgi:hypothetical protein
MPEVETFEGTFAFCGNVTEIPADLFKYNTKVKNFGGVFAYCSNLQKIPDYLFQENIQVTTDYPPAILGGAFDSIFVECPKLKLNENIFYAENQKSSIFLNRNLSFYGAFFCSSFTGEQGEAPDLWNCDFGTGTIVKTLCFGGHNIDSLSNYNEIPVEWK